MGINEPGSFFLQRPTQKIPPDELSGVIKTIAKLTVYVDVNVNVSLAAVHEKSRVTMIKPTPHLASLSFLLYDGSSG